MINKTMDITHDQSGMLDDYNENEMFPNLQPVPSPMVDKPVGNPLAKYFRLPGLSVSLPTKGVFFPVGGIELDDNGEVSVYPMKAADELLLSSPDALMNNTAIINLVASCVPQIKLPQMVSSPDLDVLLLAIRVASTGPMMESEAVCPECRETTQFEIDIPEVLNQVKTIEPVNTIRLSDDLIVYINPHTIAVQSKIFNEAFKQTRAAQALEMNDELTDEERSIQASMIMKKLAEINLYGVEQCVVKVSIPGTEVTDRQYIKDFMDNIDSKKLNVIRKAVEKLNNEGIDKTIEVECAHCKHKWTTEIEFNPATFFGDRSSD